MACPTKEGTQKAHSDAPGDEEIAGARKKLHWDSPPFVIPADIRDAWRIAGLKSSQPRKEWEKRLAAADSNTRGEFERRTRGDLPPALDEAMAAYKKTLADDKPQVATRKASEMALEVINVVVPETIGGSADLTPSNNTRTKGLKEIKTGDFSGRYMHWGVREHGMAGAMNGIALHGGLIPYGGSFLTFTDYCRPSIRLAALMGNRVIFVMTHDSIGLGEDGPTHQPVEHLAALRAIPNLNVFRPADATETAECWQLALAARRTPSVLALTRQALPALRTELIKDNLCARGAYELSPAEGDAEVSIFAAGSEVSLAINAKALIEQAGHPTRVVSVPCFELFEAETEDYRAEIIGEAPVKVAIEAGVRQGWDHIVGPDGIFIGMHRFGASAPYQELYKKFGITAEAAAEAALTRVKALA